MDGDGCVYNADRGAGKYFGAQVTNEFLIKNRLELVIRSHECKAEGYEYTHNRKVKCQSIMLFLITLSNRLNSKVQLNCHKFHRERLALTLSVF